VTQTSFFFFFFLQLFEFTFLFVWMKLMYGDGLRKYQRNICKYFKPVLDEERGVPIELCKIFVN